MNAKSTHLVGGAHLMKVGRFLTVANTLSFVRLGLLPFILISLSFSGPFYAHLALLLMVVAFATDALDGWLARRLNQVSLLGKILDPVVDKAYTILITLFLVTFRDFPLGIAGIILARGFLILALGYFLWRTRLEFPRSSWLGKLTGCVYGATALAYTLRLSSSMWFAWASLAVALISGINYLLYFRRRVEKQKNWER